VTEKVNALSINLRRIILQGTGMLYEDESKQIYENNP
jgi:hypothetical protein